MMNAPFAIPFTDDGMIEGSRSHLVRAPLDEAWRQTLATVPSLSESDRAIALSNESQVIPPRAYKPGFHLTETCRAVAIQGGWWYRGVTSVQFHPEGSLVTYTVVNVAPGWTKWLAHFFQAPEHRRKFQLDPS